MDKLLHFLLPIGLILFTLSLPNSLLRGQCLNAEIELPDLREDPTGTHCTSFSFNIDELCIPYGIAMNLEHEYEGDLGIVVNYDGFTLNVMHRPGATGNCAVGCDCGSSTDFGPVYLEFIDGGGTDPENGISGGGTFGYTADDACVASSPGVSSMADLFAGASGEVEAEICITDWADDDEGLASDVGFLFNCGVPIICACTDPFAVNYNPDANVDDGSCLFCDFLNLQVVPDFFSSCPGAIIQLGAFSTAVDPMYEWIGFNGEEAFMDDPFSPDPTVTIPPDFTGTITYTVTVTDNIGCTESWDVTIEVQPATEVFIQGEPFACFGGTVDLTTDPPFFSAYQWSTGENTEQITVGPGDYEVTVFDANSCQSIATFTVEEHPEVIPEITGPTEVCNGGSGNVTLGLTDSYLIYNWSTGETTEEITVSTPDAYEVTVTDFNGCEGTAFTVLVERDPLDVPIIGDTEFCDGANTTLEVDSGFDSFQWSTGDGSFITEVFTSGTITVTVVDSDGCEGVGTTDVQAISAPLPTIIGPDAVCPDAFTTLEVAESFSSYEWSDFSTGQTINIDASGTYSVTVTDANNCIGSGEIIIGTASVPDIAISGELEFCAGSTSELTVTSGFDAYEWSNGDTQPTTTIDADGTYTVTVTNEAGCSSTAEWTIAERALPDAIIDGDLEVCLGETGELIADPGFTTYAWSTGENSESIAISGGITYELTVTDDLGCQGTNLVEIIELPLPSPTISGDLNFCVNESTSLTTLSTYDSYEWSTGDLTETITVDQPGTVTVTVTDSDGCAGTGEANLNQVTPTVSILGATTFCEDQQTSLSVDGSFDSYNWSTGSNGSTVSVNIPGTVSVTVIDENGCEASDDIELSTWSLPPVDITGRLTFCPGTEASLNATPGYETYDWSNNDSGQSITTTTPGSYTVTVTDSNGCQNTSNTQVTEDANLAPIIVGELDFCAGTSTQLNGDPGYATYTWSNGQSGAEITVTEPGAYTLSVTDAVGCSGEVTVDVIELALPTPTISGDLNFCVNESSALTTLATYDAYEWSNGDLTQMVTIDQPGSIAVTVTDSQGCIGSSEVTLNQITPTVNILGADTFCEDQQTSLSVDGSFASYTWSTGASSPGISVSTPDTISITVIDENGCEASDDIALSTWSLPTVDITGRLTFCPGTEASLNATSGYVAYVWSNNDSEASITTSAPGNYTVTVTDSNGCQNTATTNVAEEENLAPTISGELAFCTGTSTQLIGDIGFSTYTWSNGQNGSELTITEPGNYTLSVTDDFGCSGNVTVEVSTLPLPTPGINGALEYCAASSTTLAADANYTTYQWTGGSVDPNIMVTNPGDYSLTVTDNNGCIGTTSVSVTENPLPSPSIQGTGGFCPGESTPLNAPVGFDSYAWSTGSTTQGISVGTTGDIGLTVTDSNGCAGSTTRNIAEYATATPAITGSLQFCPGESTILTGESGFDSYTWSTGSAENSITTNAPGEVSLSVVDDNGCTTSSTVSLANFTVTPPGITAPAGFCADASATLVAEAGYASYTWSNNSTQADITITEGGVYEVSVVDTNGCPSSSAADVVAYTLPNPQIGGSTTFCTGLSTTLNAGAVYTNYQWSDGSALPEISVNISGTVGLTVTDANGCIGSTSQEIIEATALSPVVSGPLEFCASQNTTLSAGNGFATYNWSTGSVAPEITVNASGTYTLSVTDAGGCSGETTVNVVENALPLVEITGTTAFCDGAASELQAPAGFPTYRWSTGAPTTSIIVMQPDTYGLTITDANGCIDSTAVDVNTQPLPGFTLEGPPEFCAGSSTSISVIPAYTSYSWNTGDSLQTVSLAANQLAVVTVTDEFGCQSTGSISVNSVALPIPDAGPETLLDCNNRSTLIGTNSEENWSYRWSGPGITTSNATQQRPTVDTEGTYTLVVTDNTLGCESLPVSTEVVDLEYVPEIVLDVIDILDCATSSVAINGQGSASGPAYVYQWFDGNQRPIANANTLSLDATTAQLYFLEVLDTITGCDNLSSIEVEEDFVLPLSEAGPGQLLTCEITSVDLDGSGSEIGEQIAYQWIAPDGGLISANDNIMATANRPGWYFLQVLNTANACSTVDSVFVTQDVALPLAEAGEDFELDCNIPTTLLDGTGSSRGDIYTYQWYSSNGVAIEGANSLQLTVNTPDTYILEVANTANGCIEEDIVVISINEAAPQELIAVTDSPTCAGDSDGAIFLSQVEGGIPPFSYSFNGSPFGDQINYGDLSAGDYEVIVEDATGCRLSRTVTLKDGNDLQLELGEDRFIDSGKTTDFILYPTTDSTFVTVDSTQLRKISWSTDINALNCLDCLNQYDVIVPTSMQFFLTIIDENGCQVSDRVTVFVRKESNIYVPNAFSPGNGGENDIFYIFANETLVSIRSFQIFNRWGENVFEVYNVQPNDPAVGWDGTHRGQLVNPAVYVWMAEVELDNGEITVIQGDVVVMR